MSRDDELVTFLVTLLFVALLFFGAYQWSKMAQDPQVSVAGVTMEVCPLPEKDTHGYTHE